MKRHLVVVIAAFLVSVAGSARATSLLLDSCDSMGCQGLTLFLDVTDLGGSFDIELTFNADAYSGSRDGLNQVGFKAIQNWTSVSLDSAPNAGWLNPPLEANTSSNNLCTNGTTSDKVCTHGFVDITGGGDFTWNFTVVGGTLLPTSDWHIGGQFADAAGPTNGQIISATSAPIPEPDARLAFAAGLLAIVPFLRRRS